MQPRCVFHQPFVTTLLQFCFTTGGSVDPGPVEEECGTVEMSHKAENPIGKGKCYWFDWDLVGVWSRGVPPQVGERLLNGIKRPV